MPIQTLGIFDSVYDWVVNKLINPIMTWLGNILSSIFNWIFEDILQPYVFPVIENLWNSIFVNIANIFYAGLYGNYCKGLELLDTITKGFDVLIGLSDITYLDEHGIQQSDTLLNYVIFLPLQHGNHHLLTPPNGTSHSNKKLIQSADEFIVNIELLNKLTVHIFRFMNLDPVNQGIQQSLRQLVDIGVLFY